MTADELDILADDYLNGEVSEEDFQAALNEHPELRSIVEFHRGIDQYLEGRLDKAYRDKVAKAITPAQKTRALWSPMRIAAAASLLLVAGTALVYFLLQASATSEELFAEHFEPYEAIGADRNSAASSNDFATAMGLYEEQQYAEAIPFFESAVGAPAFSDFFLGISYLANGDSELALSTLEPYTSDGNLLRDAAKWYQALAYLQMGDRKLAEKELEPLVANPSSRWNGKAKALIKDL